MRPEAAAAPPRARDENARLRLLAAQERRYLPPADLASLFVAERIAPGLEAQARAHWQSLRTHLRQHPDPAVAERLVALTIGLAEISFDRGDLVGQRALIDSALEVTSEERHGQVMRAQIARSALKAGDVGSAEAWLATCDARSEDLLADTAYRFARAYIATARQDHRTVISVLGVGADVPLSHAYAPECAVLCANAWERMDQRAVAVDALASVKRGLGPLARRRTTRFIAAHASWQLCPKSEPEAEKRIGETEALPIEGDAMAGLVLLVMGVFSLVWGASGLVVQQLLELAGYAMGAHMDFSISIALGVLLGLLLTPFGVLAFASARLERKRRLQGKPAAAYVVEHSRLSTESSPESVAIKLVLLITPDDAPAYYSTVETSVIATMRSNFDVGRLLTARLGRNPHEYSLEVVS
jgi:hypothetical protein